MVPHHVSDRATEQGTRHQPLCSASTLLLGAFGSGAARLHIDLCRLASAICTH